MINVQETLVMKIPSYQTFRLQNLTLVIQVVLKCLINTSSLPHNLTVPSSPPLTH